MSDQPAGPAILVVGAGSVGRRHGKNLSALGATVACVDPRADRRAQFTVEVPGAHGEFGDIAQALRHDARFDGAVVASPPSVHVDQTLALLDARIPVLLEKPVSPDLASAVRLEHAAASQDVPVLLGYTYRWWPPFLFLRDALGRGLIGTPRHARIVMSAHLADWHPWERYQDFFMASRELGGGALLDESHFIDLMIWLFGMPHELTARVEHLSDLDITTDDNVDLLAVYPGNFRVSIHLDLYGRPHSKSVTVVGEGGTIECLFDPHRVRTSSDAAGNWKEIRFECDRNDMFLGVARDFLQSLTDGSPTICTLSDGVRVMECVEAARSSATSGSTVSIPRR